MTLEEKIRIKAHVEELCEWVDEQHTEDDCAIEAEEQRDEAFKRLDDMEAKVAKLVDYLRTMQRYHRSAGTYYMEQGKTEQEDKHGELFTECISAEVMCMKMFDENDVEYVDRRIRMYGDWAKSYESRFKV